MVSPLRRHQSQAIFVNAKNHVLVDIDIPTLADPHPNGVSALLQELPAQRNLNIAKSDLQNHRMSQPVVKARLHDQPLSRAKLCASRARFAARKEANTGTA